MPSHHNPTETESTEAIQCLGTSAAYFSAKNAETKNARLFLEGAARFELFQFRLAKLMILRRRAAIEADV